MCTNDDGFIIDVHVNVTADTATGPRGLGICVGLKTALCGIAT